MSEDFIAIGNNELPSMDALSDPEICPHCKQLHALKYGTNQFGQEDRTLAFVQCPETQQVYLVGYLGRRLK